MTSLLTTLGSLRAHIEDSDFDTDVSVITSRGETLDSQSPMQWPRDSSGDSGTSMWYEKDDDYETLVEYEKPPPPLPISAPPKLPKPQPARRSDTLCSTPSGRPPPPPLPVRHSTSSSHRVPGATTPSSHHYGSYSSKFTSPTPQGKAPPRPHRGPAPPERHSRAAMSPGAGPRHADRYRAPMEFPGPQGSHSSGSRSSSGSMAHASPSGGLHTPSVPQPAQSPQYPDVFDPPVLPRHVSSDMASAFFPAPVDLHNSTCTSRQESLTPNSALPSPQGEVTHARGVQRCDKCGKWRARRRGPVTRQADRARGEATPWRQGGAIRSASASDLVREMGGGTMDHSSCSASSMTSLNDSDVTEKRHCPPPLRRGKSADVGVMASLIEQARLDEPVPSGNTPEHCRLSGSSSLCGHYHSRDQVQRGSSSQGIRSDQSGGETSRHGKVQEALKTSHYRQGMNTQISSSNGEEVPGYNESVMNKDAHAQFHRNHGASRPSVQSVSAEPSQGHHNHQGVSRQYQSSSQHVKTPRETQCVTTRRYQPSTAAHRQSRANELSSAAQAERQRTCSGRRTDRNEPNRNWRGSTRDLRVEKSHYRSSHFLKQLNIPTELPPLSSVSKFGGSSKDLRGSSSSVASGKDVLNTSAAGDDLFTSRQLHKGQRSRSSKDLRELSHGSLFGGSGQDDDIFGLSRSRENVWGSRMSRCGGSSKDLTELSRDNMGTADTLFFGETSSNLRRLSRMGGFSKDTTALYTGSLLGGSSKDLSARPIDSSNHRDSGVLSSVWKFGGSSWELSRAAEGTERTERYKAGTSSADDKLDQTGLDAPSGCATDPSTSAKCIRHPLQSISNSILDSVFGGSAKDQCERRKRLGLSCENLSDAATFKVTSGDAARGAKSSFGDSPDEVRIARNRRGDFGGSDPDLLESSVRSAANEFTTRGRRGDDPDYNSVTFLIRDTKGSVMCHGARRERDTVAIQRVSVSAPRTDRDHSSSRRQGRGEDSRAVWSTGNTRQGLDYSTQARDRTRDETSPSSNQDGFSRDLANLSTGSRTFIFGSQRDLVQINQSEAACTRMGGSSKDIREIHHVTQSGCQSASVWDVRGVTQGAPEACDVFRISDLTTARGHRAGHAPDPVPTDPNPPVKKKIIFEILV